MPVARARRPKDLERENQRLKKRVADFSLDKQILEEACKGTSRPRATAMRCRGRAADTAELLGALD